METMRTTIPTRGKGRPRKANPLTSVQRSQRYRDKKRAELHQAVTNVLAHLLSEAAKPYDASAEKRWQETFNEQCDRIDREFQETLRQFDSHTLCDFTL